MNIYLKKLKKDGYCILKNAVSKKKCDEIGAELDKISHSKKYQKFRFKDKKKQLQLINVNYINPDMFMNLVSNKKILKLLDVIFKERFILSNFNASRPISHFKKYRLHIDSRMPIFDYNNTTHVVANLCVDDFTNKNGATVILENSHKINKTKGKIKKLIAKKGSIVLMLGHLRHDIGKNYDGSRRWSIIAYYCRWWVKPTYDFVNSCTKKIFNKLDNKQREILGFNATPPIKWDKRKYTLRNTKSIPSDFSKLKKYLN